MKTKYWSNICLLCATTFTSISFAAEQYTLRMSHPWPATSDINQGLTEWANSLENASNQQIKVEIFPSQTLTKSANSYQAVVHHIADITATVQGYTANRFPLTQIIELPELVETAAQGSCVIQKLYDEGAIKQEYEDTHVLFVYTNGPGQIHMKNKQAVMPEDFTGQRIRRPTVVVGNLLTSLGAQPTGLPAPDAYEALEKDIIDGVAISWDGAKVFRLSEIAPYHTQLNLYSLSFVVTMNKQKYQSLPDNLKKIIDDHSGEQWSQHMAKVFDSLDQQAINEAKERNDHLVQPDEKVLAAWKPKLQEATDQYIEELEQKGLPAKQVYQRALELKNECVI
ncbi:MAG: TRAP transporter substrate-binding protein [Vibrio sp.]